MVVLCRYPKSPNGVESLAWDEAPGRVTNRDFSPRGVESIIATYLLNHTDVIDNTPLGLFGKNIIVI